MDRRDFVFDDEAFKVVETLVDDGFCLCGMVVDEAGRPSDYRFLRVNRHFEAMTGLANPEGRTALELVPGLEPRWIETYARVAFEGQPLRFVDESAAMGRIFQVSATPIEPRGCFAIVFRDITELRRAEAARESALRAAEASLAELNHRVMNSFASISAIIAMETRSSPPTARDALDRLQGRVQALGALYRHLDGAAQIDRVDMGAYLDSVLGAFRATLPPGVSVKAEVEPIWLPTRAALPLALVANELLSDAVRRASGEPAHLHLAFRAEALAETPSEGGAEAAGDLRHDAAPVRPAAARPDGPTRRGRLVVADDAAGPAPVQGKRDVGRDLVRAFASELGARLSEAPTAPGRRVELDLPLP